MDPLSIIASTIAIAAPVAAGLQKLRDSHHAKTDLLLLANEVAEIVLLLQELDQVLQQQNQSAESRPNPRLLQTLGAKVSVFSQEPCFPMQAFLAKPFSWVRITLWKSVYEYT